jgi:hypothetical protein
MTRLYPYPFFSDNCFVGLPVWRPLWLEDGSVTYSAIADWSGRWGPITTHYRLIWDCVPSWSPLTTRRDCGGGSLTRLHTETLQSWVYFTADCLFTSSSWYRAPFWSPWPDFILILSLVTIALFFLQGALSDERTGLYLTVQSLTGQVNWGPITIHYRLIWDCAPCSSPLTTRRGCGGGILTRLHTGQYNLRVLTMV